MFAVPTPTAGPPFQLPYSQTTLPLIIPGPHLVTGTVFAAAGTQVGVAIPPNGSGGTGNPANDTAVSTLTVSGLDPNRAISDVGVTLTIYDQNPTSSLFQDGGLVITLVSPSGTSVVLSNDEGNFGQNFINTTFEDEATVAIHCGIGMRNHIPLHTCQQGLTKA